MSIVDRFVKASDDSIYSEPKFGIGDKVNAPRQHWSSDGIVCSLGKSINNDEWLYSVQLKTYVGTFLAKDLSLVERAPNRILPKFKAGQELFYDGRLVKLHHVFYYHNQTNEFIWNVLDGENYRNVLESELTNLTGDDPVIARKAQLQVKAGDWVLYTKKEIGNNNKYYGLVLDVKSNGSVLIGWGGFNHKGKFTIVQSRLWNPEAVIEVVNPQWAFYLDQQIVWTKMSDRNEGAQFTVVGRHLRHIDGKQEYKVRSNNDGLELIINEYQLNDWEPAREIGDDPVIAKRTAGRKMMFYPGDIVKWKEAAGKEFVVERVHEYAGSKGGTGLYIRQVSPKELRFNFPVPFDEVRLINRELHNLPSEQPKYDIGDICDYIDKNAVVTEEYSGQGEIIGVIGQINQWGSIVWEYLVKKSNGRETIIFEPSINVPQKDIGGESVIA